MNPNWIEYSRDLWDDQPLPPVKRKVLVQVAAGSRPGMPPVVAVGYRKDGAGDPDSPYFVVPGVGGPVTHWADCLGDDFSAPLWLGTQPANPAPGGRP